MGIYEGYLECLDGKYFIKNIILHSWSKDHIPIDNNLFGFGTIIDQCDDRPIKSNLVDDCCIDEAFLELLSKAVQIRLNGQYRCKTCFELEKRGNYESIITECNHSAYGVLFSGGLDSTVIAVLMNR